MSFEIFGALLLASVWVPLAFAHHHCELDFGSCSDPSIVFGFNLSDSGRWGYQASNSQDFPHGWSPDIATIESFICNRLESPCNAPSATVALCRGAFNDLSGLSGQNAVDAWAHALRLGDSDNDEQHDCTATILAPVAEVTTTTVVVYSQQSASSTMTTLTLTTQTTQTSTYTDFLSTTYSQPSPSSTLTITLTLPIPTTSNEVTGTLTQTTTHMDVSYTATTTSATATSANAGTSQGSQPQSGQTGSGDDTGGGSPFDSGAAKEHRGGLLCMSLSFITMSHLLTLF